MICPRCESYNCHRSHRKMRERLLSLLGLLPWRCEDCRKRFYARLVPPRFLLRARCPQCGNLELEPIRRSRLQGRPLAQLATYLGAKALRCEGCRENFAAWRPLHRTGKRTEPSRFQQQTGAGGE